MTHQTTAGGVSLTRRAACAGLAAAGAVLSAPFVGRAATPRIVTIGCGVTETVFALGRGSDLVATDAASLCPQAAESLPKVSYPRGVVAGDVLAHRPDIVLVADDAGPRAALDEIAASGAVYLRLPEALRVEDVAAGVRLIAEAIGEADRGGALSEALAADLALVAEGLRGVAPRRAMALLGPPDADRLIVAGRGSPAAIALGFAGAENAAEEISGWSWIEPSAARALDPEAVVSLSSGAPLPLERVLDASSVRDTAACRDRRVATIDTAAFTGFGPRTAHALHAVASAIYPEARIAPPPARRWVEIETAALR